MVLIPNSVEKIGDQAFKWCDSLTNVTIPESVKELGREAFLNTWLTRVTFENPEGWVSRDGTPLSSLADPERAKSYAISGDIRRVNQ